MVWLVGLTYAELTAALSRAGGEISFTFVGIGPTGAFVCGWTLVLAYVAVCAFEAVALPTVVSYLAPGFETGYLYTVAGWDVNLTWVLVGVAGALAVGVVNYLGIRFAAFAQTVAACSLLLVGLSLAPETLADRVLPTADAMSAVYGSPWAGRVLVVGGLLGIATSWNAFFIGASRLLFATARGGMLPPMFTRLHPRYESPVAVVVVLTAIMAVAPFFGRPALVWLVDAGSLATVVAYLLVAVSFIVIRRRHPGLPRPYRTPAPSVVGWLAVTTTAFFILLYMPGSPSALVWPQEWAIVLVWVAVWARRWRWGCGAGWLRWACGARRG